MRIAGKVRNRDMEHERALVMRTDGWVGLGCLALLAAACCKTPSDETDKTQGPASAPPTQAPSAAPKATSASSVAATATKPTEGVYPLTAIKAMPDNCSKAHVLMTTAPVNEKNHYPWTWTRQAVIVHPEFKAGSGTQPKAPGEILFEMYDYGNDGKSKALIAHCADGGTCNRLAAMYKAVVPSSHPSPMCGEIPNLKGSPVIVPIPQPGLGNEDDMPSAGDTVALCARLSVCMIHSNPSTPGDPGIECQKAPSKFKTQCALKKPCSAVMECVGK
jgi:hypothetical protein